MSTSWWFVVLGSDCQFSSPQTRSLGVLRVLASVVGCLPVWPSAVFEFVVVMFFLAVSRQQSVLVLVLLCGSLRPASVAVARSRLSFGLSLFACRVFQVFLWVASASFIACLLRLYCLGFLHCSPLWLSLWECVPCNPVP